MQTIGGWFGHYFRRLVHLIFIAIPIVYYHYAKGLLAWVHLQPEHFIYLVLIVNTVFEMVRIRYGWVFFGYRKYERRQISALAWGIWCIALLLLFAPGGYESGIQYALPIATALALADPIMGELRLYGASKWLVIACGLLVVALVWWFYIDYYQLWWGYLLIMPPVVVACELPRIRWIDDNALMLLVPLMLVIWIA